MAKPVRDETAAVGMVAVIEQDFLLLGDVGHTDALHVGGGGGPFDMVLLVVSWWVGSGGEWWWEVVSGGGKWW